MQNSCQKINLNFGAILNMGRGKWLTETERIQIDALKSLGKSNRKIAKRINRSANAINNYVNNRATYGTRKSPRLHKKLTDRDVRRILLVVSRSKGCRKIREKLKSHIQRVLNSSDLVERKNRCLKGSRKRNRKCKKSTQEWDKVCIFLIV